MNDLEAEICGISGFVIGICEAFLLPGTPHLKMIGAPFLAIVFFNLKKGQDALKEKRMDDALKHVKNIRMAGTVFATLYAVDITSHLLSNMLSKD